MNKLDFIHIGFGKCMSSRLQGYWQLDDGYNSMSAEGISNAIDDVIKNSFPDISAIESQCSNININFPPFSKQHINMMSSEGLTFSFIHNPEFGDAITIKDELASKMLAGLTDKIFLLVRNPIDWIRSLHAQQVKEGGLVPMNDFLDSYRSVILNNLNLSRRVSLWSRFGAEVVILPIELAKRDDGLFWNAFEKRLGVKRPSNWQGKFDAVSNNTTAYETIEPHRRINELLQLLEGVLERSDLNQKADLLKFMNATRKVCVRRAFSYTDTETLGEIFGKLKMTPEESVPDALVLDADYLSSIDAQFLAPLRTDTCFKEYGVLDEYSLSLEQHLTDTHVKHCA